MSLKLLTLLDLVDEPRRRRLRRGLGKVAASSVLLTIMIALISAMIEQEPGSWASYVLLLFFVLSVVAGYRLYLTGGTTTTAELEAAMNALRVRITRKIAGAGLRSIERTGDLSAVYTRDLEQIGLIAGMIVFFVQMAFMLIPSLLHVAIKSSFAFLSLVVVSALLLPRMYVTFQQSRERGAAASRAWSSFHDLLARSLDGFAQIKLDQRASGALLADLRARAELVREQRIGVDEATRSTLARAYNLTSVAVGVVLFLVPLNVKLEVATINELALSVNLMTGPILFLTSQIHVFIGASVAHDNLIALEHRLDLGAAAAVPDGAEPPKSFERLCLAGVKFTYDGDEGGFTVGPLDLEIERGEVIFITGGNGSGKTTMMKLLSGLYLPDQGHLLLDGRLVDATDLWRYQALFSAIFSDQHLFRKPYGLQAVDPARMDALLARFDLRDATRFVDGRFTNIDLSSGQAKRLAMVIALLEDRPIFLLDEWAANQDPELRRYYYTELIPELKARGKTILAVSHDARFFHLADRRIDLKDGRLHIVADAQATTEAAPSVG